MKINAKFIFKIVAIVSIPVTGYLASKGAKWYQEGIEELKLKKPEADISTADKVFVAAKSYTLAAVTGAAGVGSVLAMDHISMGQLTAAGALVAANKGLIKKKSQELESYKEAVMHKLGLEKAKDIDQMAEGICLEKSYIDNMRTDEVLHTFRLRWFGDECPVIFESTLPEVLDALAGINQALFDKDSGSGMYTVGKFFSDVGRPDLISDDILNRGWSKEFLRICCECNWLPYELNKVTDEHGNELDMIDIWIPYFPNEDIEAYQKQLEENGEIYEEEEVI